MYINSFSMRGVLSFISILLILLYGVIQLIMATKWGAGLSPDSVEYILTARSIVENGNIKDLGSHYPPLYPMILALISVIGVDVLTVARWTQIFLYIGNISVFGYIIYQITAKAILPTIIGCLLLASSHVFLEIHAMAWSEPLFLSLSLVGLMFLIRHLLHCDLISLVGSAVFFGFALSTRYAGLAFILSSAFAIFSMSNHNWKNKFYNSILFFATSLVPFFVWVVRNIVSDRSATNREFVFHPVPWERVLQGVKEILSWFHLSSNMYSFLLFIIAILFLLSLSRRIDSELKPQFFPELCFMFVVIYIFFILFSISFLDFIIPLDRRILSPVYLFTFLGLVVLSSRYVKSKHFKIIGYGAFSLLIAISVMQVKIQNKYLAFVANGNGYASKAWIESDVLEWLKKLPNNTIVYSNAPEPIKLYTHAKSHMIPRHTHTGTITRNENIFHELHEMAELLRQNSGYIIYFKSINWRWYLPTEQQLHKILPLEPIYHGKDGDVYFIKN